MDRFLRQRPNTRVTTLIDLYGIGSTMLALAASSYPSAASQASAIEQEVANAFGNSPRLVPYIQVQEFEALLFADPGAFESGTGYSGAALTLAATEMPPEEINGTHPPSKHILASVPGYDKVNDGVLAAQEIGIPTIRAACPRFDVWLTNLGL